MVKVAGSMPIGGILSQMCSCVIALHFTHYANPLNASFPPVGIDPGSTVLDSGRLGSARSFQLGRPLFLAMIRKSQKRAKIEAS